MSEKVGVYICHCGTNIAKVVDVAEVSRWADEQDNVEISRDYKFMCSSLGQDLIEADIKEKGLTRVVVASCSPHMHEKTFRTACQRGGLNPFLFEMANIREHASWITDDKEAATNKAKALTKAAIDRVAHHQPLEPLPVDINPNTLIVGGGIAGISAALELADAGYHVYLVEREPSIGGHMAQLDKTFPTLDCSACILTPKMVEVGQHPNISLYTWSEVEAVDGHLGNFKVTVRKKARYINEEHCTGCGICIEKCPFKVTDKVFEAGLGQRKVIYRPFPQAVPKYPLLIQRIVSTSNEASVKLARYSAPLPPTPLILNRKTSCWRLRSAMLFWLLAMISSIQNASRTMGTGGWQMYSPASSSNVW